MSRFFSEKYASLIPYVPGEQPKNMEYVKLNTNESPFMPSEQTVKVAMESAKNLQLYSDPECTPLVVKASELFGIDKDEILFTNGSDEILNFAFMAFCDKAHGAAFADITYGFYPVFAEINNVPYTTIPLANDFTINVDDYIGINKTIFIANPNAPTGITISLSDIERILQSNPNNVIVIDEAYVDFGGESAVSLIHRYDNLLVTQTFSKSRGAAGARLGFGIACKALIQDLNTIKYSTNPYNVNSMTMMAGYAILCDEETTRANCRTIMDTRAYTVQKLTALGFEVLPSSANFIFAKHPSIEGEELYLKLKENGVLVRHFTTERIKDYNRITIGSKEQMDVLINKITTILGGIQ